MPAEIRALRDPWPSLAGRVPGLTPALERDFRFGQRVTLTERGFLLGGTIKGGSSSMWVPAPREVYDAYLGWRAIDGVEDGAPDRAAFEQLGALLGLYGVELVDGDERPPRAPRFRRELGAIYALMLGALRELPAAHLERGELARIQLGGWGPDGAKASAYVTGTVHLYDFALRGARRTFAGLFLHELGHAHERALAPAARGALVRSYGAIVEAGALFGVEFLQDAASRRGYQRFAFTEFLAEFYLAYTACGEALRGHAAAAPQGARTAWRRAYEAFRESFGGIEYA
jgi:hypothetical protein